MGRALRPRRSAAIVARLGKGEWSSAGRDIGRKRAVPGCGRRDSHGSQSGSSERDLCNARRRARRLCGTLSPPRLLHQRRSSRNQRVLLRRVAGSADIVCQSVGRLLTVGGPPTAFASAAYNPSQPRFIPANRPRFAFSALPPLIIAAACPSSDDLRHIAGFQKGGSGSSVIEIMRHAVGAASNGFAIVWRLILSRSRRTASARPR